MIDPKTVLFTSPIHHRACPLYLTGFAQVSMYRRYSEPFFWIGHSNIAIARNYIVNYFLNRTQFDHLVMVDDDIGFTVQDFDILLSGDEEAVCAEYMKKDQFNNRAVARWGLGFARVSRNVFSALDELETEDGRPLLKHFRVDRDEMRDYFPQGVDMTGVYRQEDHAFWMMVQLTGISARVERRCHLRHTGDYQYTYDAETLDAIEAEAGAQ